METFFRSQTGGTISLSPLHFSPYSFFFPQVLCIVIFTRRSFSGRFLLFFFFLLLPPPSSSAFSSSSLFASSSTPYAKPSAVYLITTSQATFVDSICQVKSCSTCPIQQGSILEGNNKAFHATFSCWSPTLSQGTQLMRAWDRVGSDWNQRAFQIWTKPWKKLLAGGSGLETALLKVIIISTTFTKCF